MQVNRTKRRLPSILCALCVVLAFISMFSIPAYAALTDSNIGASISGNTDSSSIEGTKITAKVRRRYVGGSKSYTITLTNNSGQEAVLSFVYSTDGGSGNTQTHTVKYYTTSTASATSVSLASGNTFKQTLQAGGKVELYASPGIGDTVQTTLTDISLKIKTSANVTFAPDATVSYSVGYVDGNGAAQTAAVAAGGSSVTVNAELSEGVSITPTTEGYACESATATISGTIYADAEGKFTVAKDETVTPVFISTSGAKPFTHLGNGKTYYTLGAAVNAGSGTVLLNQSCTLPAGDYTIPSGVTLLIPYDIGNTLVTNGDATVNLYSTDPPSVPARTEYRSLTMASGAKIKVASGGAISISSGRANQFIGQVGPYGAIYMDSSSNITVQNGGTLYAWGYIFHGTNGSGTVTVESGGTVYEPISIMDYPGSTSLTTALTDAKVFPMRTYALRNVEVPMTLKSGAKEYAFSCLYGSNFMVGTNPLYILVIANGKVGNETPVFQNAGTITKAYENSRVKMLVNGNFTLNSMTVEVSKSIGTVKISSSDTSGFYLPGCYDMVIESGTTTVMDNVIMSEGATLTINSGAVLNTNSKNVYILDADEDPGTVSTSNGCGIDVQDVHGKYYTNVPRDAVLDVNGTLKASGGFYTSSSGASITSSKGGGVIEVSGTSTNTSVGVKNTNAHTSVEITPAKLLNGDTTYLPTANGGANTYTYTNGKWICKNHVNDEGVVKSEPTCNSEGSKEVTCTLCGTVSTVSVPALTHTEVEIPAVAATCTATGLTEGKHCSVCGEVLVAQTVVPALGHTEVADAAVAATCTATGLTEGKHCSVCGEVLVAQTEVPALGHTEVADVAVAATCTATGLTEGKHCSVCREVLIAQTEVPALGHTSVVDAAVTPTCTATGLTEGSHCSVCGEILTAQEIVNALGHNEIVDEAVAATCTATGLTEGKHCDRCNTTLVAQNVVDALGHSWNEGETTVAASCSQEGSMLYTCSVCGGTRTETIAKLAHTEEIVAAVAPTCSATGLTEGKKCSICGEVILAQDEVPALGHEYNEGVVTTKPTCTAAGTKTFTCSTCGHSYTEAVEALGHTEEVIPAVDATCTKAGATAGTKCSVCGNTISAPTEVPALGHTEEILPGNNASCTEGGLTEGKKCTVCGTTTVAQETIPSLGHQWNAENGICSVCDEECKHTEYDTEKHTCKVCGMGCTHSYDEGEITTNPGCTATGIRTLTCSLCTHQKTEEIAAFGHTWQNATCTVAKTCSVCGSTEGEALGHSYKSVVTAPSCNAAGYTTHTCSRCGDVYTDAEVAATGHQNTTTATVDATCTADGSVTVTCDDCGATISTEKISATGHTAAPSVEENRVESTCTVAGSYDSVVYCNICREKLSSEKKTLPLASHAEGAPVIENSISATCTADGKYDTVVYCTECNEEQRRQTTIVPALGHTEVIDAAVTADCTKTGLTEGKHCSICNAVLAAQEVVPALGHEEVVDAAVDATCTEAGKTEGKHCSVCGEVLVAQEEVPALGHSYSSSITTSPTCTGAGIKTFTCNSCGNSYTEAITATGHSWHNATYTAPKTCSVCGAKEGEPLVDVTEQPEDVTDEQINAAVGAIDGVIDTVQPDDHGFEVDANKNIVTNAKDDIQLEVGATVTDYETILEITMNAVVVDTGSIVTKITYDVTPILYAKDADGKVVGSTAMTSFEEEITFRLPVDANTSARYARVHHTHNGQTIDMGLHEIHTNGDHKYVEVKAKEFSEFGVETIDACATHTGGTATCQKQAVCTVCGESYGELGDHNYVDGVCAECGIAEYAIKIAASNARLGNELAMNFVVKKSEANAIISTGNDLYMKITKHYADGSPDVVEITYFNDWDSYNSTYYSVTFSNIAAKEMSDIIEAQLFYADGTPASPVRVDGIRSYVERGFANNAFTTDAVRTLAVDMLNYGAAAQVFFNYNTNDLANSTLTTEQLGYATSENISCTNSRVEGVNYYASNMNLGSSLTLSMFFKNVTPSMYKSMYAIVSFTDYRGEAKTVRIEGTEFARYNDNVCRIYISEAVAADSSQLITCTIYDSNNQLYAQGTDSIESIVARAGSGTSNAALTYQAMMKFTRAAYNYLINR